MSEKLKRLFFLLTLTVLTSCTFVGCSLFAGGSSSKGSTSNSVYIMKPDDYTAFCDNMFTSESDSKKKKDDSYTAPDLEELTIGETYYIVCFTTAETSDGSDIKFGKVGSIDIRLDSSESEIEEVIEIENCWGSHAIVSYDSGDGDMLEFSVDPNTSGSKAEFVAVIEFCVNKEAKLDVSYHINGTSKKDTYGIGNSATSSASAYYSRKINISDLKVSYLHSDNFVYGRYDAASLVSSIDMKVGRDYYMVISAKIKSEIAEINNDMVTFNMHLSSRNILDGTLEEAESGENYSEPTTKTEKNIIFSYEIPEADDGEKAIEIIIKLTPVSLGNPTVSFSFSADQISVLGNKTTEAALVINGEEKVSEGFEYTLSPDKTYYRVTGLGEAKGTIFLIPAEYNGLPVNEIASGAFANFNTIRSIEVSEGIEIIEDGAFSGCNELLEVKLPSTATVGRNVLSECNSLNTLTVRLNNSQLKMLFGSSNSSIPASLKTVTVVGDTSLCANAFVGGTNITKLTLPATLTSVATSALKGCTSLSELNLESGNQSLFLQCGILYEKSSNTILGHVAKFSGEMTYPSGITAIPGGDMSEVTKITVPNTVTTFSSNVTLAPKEFTGPQVIFASVSKDNLTKAVITVASGASAPSFSGATKLVSVSLPEGITSLPSGAFLNCESLTSVTLPSDITAIPANAFKNCKKLTSVNIPNGVETIGASAFSGCESLTTVTVPSAVTSIGNYAFENCKKLSSAMTLPSGMNNVPKGLFSGCESLTSVTVHSGVAYIYENAFYGCANLSSVSLPDTAKNIHEFAFYGSGLKTVNIPASVTYIGRGAFESCQSLTSITVGEGSADFYASGGILYNADKNKIIQVPKGISGKVTVLSGVTAIYATNFSGCTKMTELIIPNSVSCIEIGALTSCTALNWVEWRDTYGNRDQSSTYNSSKRQEQYVSWDDSAELAGYLKRTYADRYFGNPNNL